ncbi:hypothetical protein N9206_01505, partial [bacterium]|nr:hypothetical protein [bacterium]
MNRLLPVWFLISLLAFGEADPSLNTLGPFLKKHCIECHGPEKQKGDYRFDLLKNDLSDLQTLELWQGILDQLNLGEMPPKKQAQPSREESAEVIATLTP